MKNDEPDKARQEALPSWKNRDKTTVELTWKPTVAGVIDIIMGIIGILVSLSVGIILISCSRWWGFSSSEEALYWLISASFLAIGIMAIKGGKNALNREKWVWALIGSICTLVTPLVPLAIALDSPDYWLSVLIFGPVGTLGISAIVLTLLSKNEFG